MSFDDFWTLYDELINSLNDYKIISQKYEGRFVIITGITRVSAIYNFVKEFLDRNSHQSKCRVSIGISDVYNESHTLQEAYLQAKKLREDYLFDNFNNIKTAEMSKEGKNRKKIVDDALKIIADEYGNKLQIKKIAERLYVSESHLMHEFKESLGLTFIECLTEYRMMKAKELLGEGSFRIKEVASRVGFSDVRYFSVVFKDSVGMSPSEYLEKSKKNHDK